MIEEEFNGGVLSAATFEVFLASFSAAADLKSQWMEYAANGAGVSIAFDLRKIRPSKDLQLAVTFAPCVYDDEVKKTLIARTFAHYVEEAERLFADTNDQRWVSEQIKNWTLVNRVFNLASSRADFARYMDDVFDLRLRIARTLAKFDLLRVASNCKHDWYVEEKEWRLVLPHTVGTPMTDMKKEFRGPREAIPYVAHDLFSKGSLPFVEIMCGPFCNEDAVAGLIHKYGIDVPLTRSRAPIRSVEEI